MMRGALCHGAIVRRAPAAPHWGAPRSVPGRAPIFAGRAGAAQARGARIAGSIAVARRRAARPPASVVVLAVAAAARHPDLAPGGGSRAALALQLAAGLALRRGRPAHGTPRRAAPSRRRCWSRRPGLALGVLPAPPDGAVLFTLALVGAGAPGGRRRARGAAVSRRAPRGALDRVAIAAGYVVTVGLLGVLLRSFDPPQAGCFDCPDNLLLVAADPGASAWLERWTPRVAAATEVALAALGRRAAAAASRGRAARSPRRSRSPRWPCSRWRRSRTARRGRPSLWLATCAALGRSRRGLRLAPAAGAAAPARPSTRITVAAPAGARGRPSAPSAARSATRRSRSWCPHPETRAPITLDGAPLRPRAARASAHRRRAPRPSRRLGRAPRRHAALDSHARSPAAGLTLEREALRAAQRLQAQAAARIQPAARDRRRGRAPPA